MAFEVKDADYAAKVRDSFARQSIMGLIGASLGRVEPGEVEILLPFRADLCQQHGFFHAGVTATIADSAAGYASFTLFPPGASVLTTEYKLHLLSPAEGERLRAQGRVLKPGRSLVITETEVFALQGGREKLCAKLLGTFMVMVGRSDMKAG